MDEITIEMFKDKERKNLFATYNHIEMVMVEEDHAVFRLNIQPESKNSYGMVHGGAIYAMADNATGFAAHTDGRNYVTQTSALHFLRNQSEGEIQADARVRHRGHSTCLVAVDILGEDEKLLEGAGLAEKPARWSGNIHTEAEQMRTLVEQMLTLARADNGVRPAAMEPLNLSDVATDCVLAFEPVAFEAGKPLEERIAADITVVGDADRLRRLISILLDNAVKYGAEGGHITLTLEKTDRQARLTVSNPGDPIPPEHLAHLFERFYRADASRGEKSGFGLGLAIADTIAREHKGVLKAESDTASTRFTFTMPLKK